MSPSFFVETALDPGMSLLPPRWDSVEARALVLAICLQESGLYARRQTGGPARGYAQFELIGVRGVCDHPTAGPVLREACRVADYPITPEGIYAALEFADVLSVCCARALLWTLPDRLAGKAELDLAWNQYLAAWRPGKPRVATWERHYTRAWRLVAPEGRRVYAE